MARVQSVHNSGMFTAHEQRRILNIPYYCKPAWKTDQVLGVIGAQN